MIIIKFLLDVELLTKSDDYTYGYSNCEMPCVMRLKEGPYPRFYKTLDLGGAA